MKQVETKIIYMELGLIKKYPSFPKAQVLSELLRPELNAITNRRNIHKFFLESYFHIFEP